ncbi:hypothetical protein Salat_2557300 [Sesamum alatum]|uniref:Uncharacterized protein n=1 Tax=Sesamum alatum TaxID=300844 RepID=A0AAE2CCR9_9LAMI|nr:hypothetical protein Salat_2557300 [Sesamum alatum]
MPGLETINESGEKLTGQKNVPTERTIMASGDASIATDQNPINTICVFEPAGGPPNAPDPALLRDDEQENEGSSWTQLAPEALMDLAVDGGDFVEVKARSGHRRGRSVSRTCRVLTRSHARAHSPSSNI